MRDAFPHLHSVFTLACALLLVGTALVHSILGEKRLIGPLLSQREGILQHHLARFLIRVVWHFMSLLFLILAAALTASMYGLEAAFAALLAGIGFGIGGAGLADAIGSQGRHVGWPLLVLIGVLALLSFTSIP